MGNVKDPIIIRNHVIRNRLTMAPTVKFDYAGEDGMATPKHVEHYRERAAHQCGLFCIFVLEVILMFSLFGCGKPEHDVRIGVKRQNTMETDPNASAASLGEEEKKDEEGMEELSVKNINENPDEMMLLINDTEVPILWEDNESVAELRELSPLTIKMSKYGGFEQVGAIGQSIAREDEQMETEYGDVVLYSGNQLVIFYGSNSWAYTKLGHIELTKEEMTELLGKEDVVVTLQ